MKKEEQIENIMNIMAEATNKDWVDYKISEIITICKAQSGKERYIEDSCKTCFIKEFCRAKLVGAPKDWTPEKPNEVQPF